MDSKPQQALNLPQNANKSSEKSRTKHNRAKCAHVKELTTTKASIDESWRRYLSAVLRSVNSRDQAFAHALIHRRAAATRLSSAIKNGGKRQAAEYLKKVILYLKAIKYLKKLENNEVTGFF